MSITIIVGKPGAGKTVFATNILANKMFNSFEDMLCLKQEIKKLKEGGFTMLDLPPQRHLCYADYKVKISRTTQAYTIDGYKIGLPNPYFETIFIPPYSTIFLDEAQRYYDSRNSKGLRSEVYNWYQLHRQNHYNIYLICQRLGNIDLNIRSIADKVIVIDELNMKKDKYGRVSKFTWNIREFESADTAEDYCLKKDRSEYANLGIKQTVISKLPLFQYYDSFANKPAFFNGKEYEKFNYTIEPNYKLTIDSFIEYNENHLYSAPKGYWKSADYDKKVLEKMEKQYGN